MRSPRSRATVVGPSAQVVAPVAGLAPSSGRKRNWTRPGAVPIPAHRYALLRRGPPWNAGATSPCFAALIHQPFGNLAPGALQARINRTITIPPSVPAQSVQPSRQNSDRPGHCTSERATRLLGRTSPGGHAWSADLETSASTIRSPRAADAALHGPCRRKQAHARFRRIATVMTRADHCPKHRAAPARNHAAGAGRSGDHRASGWRSNRVSARASRRGFIAPVVDSCARAPRVPDL